MSDVAMCPPAQYTQLVFTGIVQTTGIMKSRVSRGPGARLVIGTELGPLELGESIAVSGVCLTVQTIVPGGFACDASGETLSCTTLGEIPAGGRVHLERALRVGDRLGGHILSGHVDGKVRLQSRDPLGEAERLVFEVLDRSLFRYVAQKGSVAIDGVSLTVNAVTSDTFDVAIIPHTLEVTTLGELRPGQLANLEVDVLARYVARILESGPEGASQGSRDDNLRSALKTAGFM